MARLRSASPRCPICGYGTKRHKPENHYTQRAKTIMAKKKLHVVRVVIPAMDQPFPELAKKVDGKLLECLRYAGLVTVHHDDEERQTFDIHAPRHIGPAEVQTWSEMNANRMKSFGFNAVSALSTI